MRRVAGLAIVLFASYTVVHFVHSGVSTPLASPNLRQIASEMRPVDAFLQSGEQVSLPEARPYGPVFYLAMHAALRSCSDEAWALSRCLYGVNMAALGIALVAAALALRRWLRQLLAHTSLRHLGWMVALLAALWLNFAPLNYIIATKMVEMWELALMMAGLYAFLCKRRAIAGACLAAAMFIKMLPGIFLLYFLIRDRRTFAWSVAAAAVILTCTHVIYGPRVGWRYPLSMAASAVRPSDAAAIGWHENLALKNQILKAFGHLEIPSGPVEPSAPHRYYFVQITPEARATANLVGLTLQLLGLAGFIALLIRPDVPGASEAWRETRVLWEWALVSVAIIVLSPAATFEYMLLCIFAFSFVMVALIVLPRLRRTAIVATFAAAVGMVAIVIPRTVFNAIVPLDLLRRASGYVHLTPSEVYQYFGLPLMGLGFLLIALLLIDRELRRNPQIVERQSHPRYQ